MLVDTSRRQAPTTRTPPGASGRRRRSYAQLGDRVEVLNDDIWWEAYVTLLDARGAQCQARRGRRL